MAEAGVVLEVVPDEAPPRAGNAGFWVESPPGAGALLKRDGVCDCVPLGAAPNNGLGVVSVDVVDAGLFTPPNRPPVAADPPPNSLLDGCEAGGGPAGVVELLPNRLFGAGVADPPPPNKPVLVGWPGVVDSEVLGA